MNLGLFNGVFNNDREKGFIQNFIDELSNCLKKSNGEINKNMENGLKEEGTLYQVVGITLNGVYLQNMNNNKVAEERNISKELKEKLGNDYILSYKNGKYIFEKELTDEFFNSLV